MKTKRKFPKGATLRVRKQNQNGSIRYRYNRQRIDYSIYNLQCSDGFKFSYGISMNIVDMLKVEEMWKNKLTAGGHLFKGDENVNG